MERKSPLVLHKAEMVAQAAICTYGSESYKRAITTGQMSFMSGRKEASFVSARDVVDVVMRLSSLERRCGDEDVR